jgi:hypothetical protein
MIGPLNVDCAKNRNVDLRAAFSKRSVEFI